MTRALTTQEAADHINAILGAVFYDDQSIRAEIRASRLEARSIGTGTLRRSYRISPTSFLHWATKVLHDQELERLRSRLDPAV